MGDCGRKSRPISDFFTPCKIMAGMGEMFKSDFQIQPIGPNLWCILSGTSPRSERLKVQ